MLELVQELGLNTWNEVKLLLTHWRPCFSRNFLFQILKGVTFLGPLGRLTQILLWSLQSLAERNLRILQSFFCPGWQRVGVGGAGYIYIYIK